MLSEFAECCQSSQSYVGDLRWESKARICHYSWLTRGSDERGLGQQSEWLAEGKWSRHHIKTEGIDEWLYG